MADREHVMANLEGLTFDGWREYHSDSEVQNIASEALSLLKEDCHNCKLECLLQKYDELKEKYDALLKEQKHGETFTVIDTKTGKEADEYTIALHED